MSANESASTTEAQAAPKGHPTRVAEIDIWRDDLRVFLRVLQDSETPRKVSGLMLIVLAWGLLPVDPLPDVIPLAGVIDDATVFMIVRSAIYRLVPDEIIDHHAEVVSATSRVRIGPGRTVAGIFIVQLVVIVAILGGVAGVLF